MNTDGHGFRSAPLRLPTLRSALRWASCVILLLPLLLAACAESDPYKRLDPCGASDPIARKALDALSVGMSPQQLVEAFNNRWPSQFKCVQTVTIDFGPVTKTFNALLVIQRPGKFRLQGMTEQGIKIFEIAHNEGGDHVIFKADEMNDQTIASISRDIRRVFLDPFKGVPERASGPGFLCLTGNSASHTSRARMIASGMIVAGVTKLTPHIQPVVVDEFEFVADGKRSFAFRYYDWIDHHGRVTPECMNLVCPSVIVLRDGGRDSNSYPYKLTIKISELTVRDTPWPEKTFNP